MLNLSADVDYSLASRLLTCWGVETRQGYCKASDLQVTLPRISALVAAYLCHIIAVCITVEPYCKSLSPPGVAGVRLTKRPLPHVVIAHRSSGVEQ